MRITLPNGIIVEMSQIDEISAVLPGLIGSTAPLPQALHDDDETVPAEEILTALVKPSRRQGRPRIPNPPIPAGGWPQRIYLTEQWKKALDVLKSYHPEGLSSEEVAIELGVPHPVASGWLGRLRARTPLIVSVGGKFGLTEIGKDKGLEIIVTNKPSLANIKEGWNRFTPRNLPDGRHRRKS